LNFELAILNSQNSMRLPRLLAVPAFLTSLCGLTAGVAAAQAPAGTTPAQITRIAAATTGTIGGVVLDERGQPLDGVVVSAMGNSTSFAVSDRAGQFTLRSLMPGPYLVRAHLTGYLPARGVMVSVRPSARTVSTFTLRREGATGETRIAAAGLGGAEISAAPSSEKPRDESETAWRLRHLKRSVLRDSATVVAMDADDEEARRFGAVSLLGRAVESSARAAGSLFTNSLLQGQVNLLTTGAFDNPTELLQLERTRGVAYFALGAPVGLHGDWTVKAAVNQGDLSSWVLAGAYITRDPARHRYHFGMSYGLHRYQGGNPAALAAMTETARNVGTVYAHDEWKLSERITLGYGANYAHYDYLMEPAHFSPRLAATVSPTPDLRVRVVASRAVTAPGAEEFLPPARTQVLPPQRTFAPLTRDGFRPEDLQHYEVAVERLLSGATIGVRAFHQRVDEQHVTIFGLRQADTAIAEIGHYFVASAGDIDVTGWGVTVSHALADNVRGSFDYSMSDASWTTTASADRARLRWRMPSALRSDVERIHDFTTSLETAFPDSETRVFFLYKMNSGYIRADGSESRPGLDGRWDFQVNQGLPFMNFLSAEWEMLVAVRNLFRESFAETSIYDELLVARPPKRLIGGLTVKF
jgi:outer membrane receptor protein involved in Fe transport